MSEPTHLPPLGPGAPTPPIDLADVPISERLAPGAATPVPVPDPVLDRLRQTGAAVSVDDAVRVEASRDWWPGAMLWAADGQVAGLAGAVVTPMDSDQVAAVLRLCNAARVPVTAAGGRSGVCGASIPAHGGVALDTTALTGILDIDEVGGVVDVAPGTFGDHFEAELRAQGYTAGHWPQSVALSTVGGWVACRGAGQLSNRYGKIEDMVVGLDVVLADGRAITTGGTARAAAGPDLTQLFIGSEGTLGIITGIRLRIHPAPSVERHATWTFPSFGAANDACRRILQRGARTAVLRVYDAIEADRSYGTGDATVLLVMDEGDPVIIDAAMTVVDQECAETAGASRHGEDLVQRWLGHRNDVAALASLIGNGFVVDTMEVTVPWGRVEETYDATTAALRAVDDCLVASAHQSHAYPDSACLYFSFAGRPERENHNHLYRAMWDAGQRAVLGCGGSLSHHHGVGMHRSRYVAEALGAAHDVLVRAKQALDPNGILNPGKLGLVSPFGPTPLATGEADA